MTVLVEAGAGVKSHYYDEQYSEPVQKWLTT